MLFLLDFAKKEAQDSLTQNNDQRGVRMVHGKFLS